MAILLILIALSESKGQVESYEILNQNFNLTPSIETVITSQIINNNGDKSVISLYFCTDTLDVAFEDCIYYKTFEFDSLSRIKSIIINKFNVIYYDYIDQSRLNKITLVTNYQKYDYFFDYHGNSTICFGHVYNVDDAVLFFIDTIRVNIFKSPKMVIHCDLLFGNNYYHFYKTSMLGRSLEMFNFQDSNLYKVATKVRYNWKTFRFLQYNYRVGEIQYSNILKRQVVLFTTFENNMPIDKFYFYYNTNGTLIKIDTYTNQKSEGVSKFIYAGSYCVRYE